MAGPKNYVTSPPALSMASNAKNEERSKFDQVNNPRADYRFPSASLSPMINLNKYDSKGQCVRHPYMPLRKIKLFRKS